MRFDSWVRVTESTDPGHGRGAVFGGLRCVLVSSSPGHADELAQELRGRGALVVVSGLDGDGLARATTLDPHVVLLDESLDGPLGSRESIERWDRLGSAPALRGARPVRFRWAELRRTACAPLDLDVLGARLAPVMQVHHAFWRAAAAGHGFEAALDRVGSMGSLVRLLASGAGTLRASITSRQGDAEIVAIDGLVVAARWSPRDAAGRLGEALEGPEAFARALDVEHGLVVVDRLDRPFEVNLVLPVEEAIARARSEEPASIGNDAAKWLELRRLEGRHGSSRPPARPTREQVAQLLRAQPRDHEELTRESRPDGALADVEPAIGRRRARVASGTRMRVHRDDPPAQDARTAAIDLGATIDAQPTRRIVLPAGDDDPTARMSIAAREAAVARAANDDEVTLERAAVVPGAVVPDAVVPDAAAREPAVVRDAVPRPAGEARGRRRTAIAIAIRCVGALAAPAIVATGIVLVTEGSRPAPEPRGVAAEVIVAPAPSAPPRPAEAAPARAERELDEPRVAEVAPAAEDADPAPDIAADDLTARRRRSDALVAAARRHLHAGDRGGAESRLLEAHRVAPFSPHPAAALARIHADAGDLDAARLWIDRAIALRPRRDHYRAFRRALDRASRR